MRFSILVIVKEDDGSTLRGDNKKMVSSLRIPVGIDSSTRTRFLELLKLKNARCFFAAGSCYNFNSVESAFGHLS
jgi:hypothetical protein